MRMRSQVMRIFSSGNNVMHMRILLGLLMHSTWLRMRDISLEELFWKFGAKFAKTPEFIPARPDHQNVKKSENFSWRKS